MEVGPEAQAGSQGRVGDHASEWGPEELAAEALVAPCARPPVWAGSTPSASRPRYGLWRSPLRPGCRHGARPPEVPVHEPRSGAEARGRRGRPRGSSAGLAGGAWCVSGRSGSLEPGKGQWAERRAGMGRGDVGSSVRRRHLRYMLSGSCRDVPAAVLRVGAGHSVAGSSWPCSERRKEERRGASASAPASRDRSRRAGAHGAGLPSSPHPDGAAASIRPREPWARGSDCAGTDPRQHPGRAPRELPSPSKPTQTGQRIVAWDVA